MARFLLIARPPFFLMEVKAQKRESFLVAANVEAQHQSVQPWNQTQKRKTLSCALKRFHRPIVTSAWTSRPLCRIQQAYSAYNAPYMQQYPYGLMAYYLL